MILKHRASERRFRMMARLVRHYSIRRQADRLRPPANASFVAAYRAANSGVKA